MSFPTAVAAFRVACVCLSVLLPMAAPFSPAGQARAAETPQGIAGIEELLPSLDALYLDLHRNPELSFQEEKTAAKLASRLRSYGYEVTEHVGGLGIVGVLSNGAGPTVMLRTDMDALPIQEQTGLPYASTATVKNQRGEIVPVMHACGHDVHMTTWMGAAALLARSKDRWRGTVVLVGQPAEEILQGAQAMVKDGLLSRFPKPDFVLGLHVSPVLPTGQIGIISGPASSASNAVDITFFGKGGHGAAPHRTIDPIVMAARAVVTLQTIVSREVNPFDHAVVTVGTFHAGTKRNIIGDEARLELTVRSYKPEIQKQLLASIERIAKAEAGAAGAPKEPVVFVDPKEASEVVTNDPALCTRLAAALRHSLGEKNVVPHDPVSSSEDFGVLGRAAGVPSVQLRLGVYEPSLLARLKAEGKTPPLPHTAGFAPDRESSLRTGAAALFFSAIELLGSAGPTR